MRCGVYEHEGGENLDGVPGHITLLVKVLRLIKF